MWKKGIFLANILITFVVFLLLGVNFDPLYYSGSMVLMLVLVMLIFILLIVVIADKMLHLHMKKYVLSNIGVLLVLLYINHSLEKSRIKTLKASGGEIITALEAFHKEKGIYPSDLKELIPVYLEEIPETTPPVQYDKLFGYSKPGFTDQNVVFFQGSAFASEYYFLYYNMKTGKWEEVFTDE